MNKLILLCSMTLLVTTQAATPEIYSKLWRDPSVNARIDRNIEQYRKGDAAITVMDAAGQPVNGAKISARQTGHEFLFGCNAFVLGQLQPAELEQRYEAAFAKLFNFATVPLYWEGTEPERGPLARAYARGFGRDVDANFDAAAERMGLSCRLAAPGAAR